MVLIFNKTSFTPYQQNKIRLNVNKTRFALHIVLYSIDMRSIERSEVLYSTDMSCKGDVAHYNATNGSNTTPAWISQ